MNLSWYLFAYDFLKLPLVPEIDMLRREVVGFFFAWASASRHWKNNEVRILKTK